MINRYVIKQCRKSPYFRIVDTLIPKSKPISFGELTESYAEVFCKILNDDWVKFNQPGIE